MLRHFVIPASQLQELPAFNDELADSPAPWSLSVLGPRCERVAAWDAAFGEYLADVETFLQQHGQLANIAALEYTLPVELAARGVESDDIEHFLHVPHRQIEAAELGVGHVFVEVLPGPAADAVRWAIVKQIGDVSPGTTAYGLKLRTGGLEAAAFPSADELAAVIHLCAMKRVAWKATAGLHHPLPQSSRYVGATMHGFLDLLVATTLACVRDLDVATLSRILAEQDAMQFVFDDDGLRWRDDSASVSQIAEARKRFVSFGSCSFNEPRMELAEIGLGVSTEEHV